MLRLLAIAAVTWMAVGCGGSPTERQSAERQTAPAHEAAKGGHKKGDVIKLESPSWLYQSEKWFRKNLEITQAGSDKIDLINPDDLMSLWTGSEVRVLTTVDGGMKVVVEKGMDLVDPSAGRDTKIMPGWTGKVGWIIDPELDAKVRDANYKPIAK